MKILFVEPAMQAYGSEKSLLGLMDAIDRRQVDVVCPLGSAIDLALKSHGTRTHNIEFGRYSLGRNPLWHVAFLARMLLVMRKSAPEVVVINLDGNTPLVVLAARLMGIPVVRFSRFEFSAPKSWRDRLSWLGCAAIICPSEFVKDQIVQWMPKKNRGRVHCLYNPQEIPKNRRQAIDRSVAFGLQEGNITIGYFGRLHPGKRVETLIQAVPKIYAMTPNVHVLVVGEDDHSVAGKRYHAELKQICLLNHVDHLIEFLGYQENVFEIMSRCDVCVLPSESESFGRVLVEAWACRVPTIASNVSGCREITLASGGGDLFMVGDHEDLARKVVQMVKSPEISATCGERGYAWVKENCDPATYASQFLAILEQVRRHLGHRGA